MDGLVVSIGTAAISRNTQHQSTSRVAAIQVFPLDNVGKKPSHER